MRLRLCLTLGLAAIAAGCGPKTPDPAPTPAPVAATPTPAATDDHGHAHADPAASEDALMVSGSPAEVAMQVEDAIRQSPKKLSYRMQAAQFYMNQGRYPAAIVHLKVATSLSDDPLGWIALGDAAMLSKQFALAQKAYDQVARLEPDSARFIHGQAQLWVAQERFKKAGQLLERGVQKHPDDVDLRAALGNLYLVVNKPRRAVETLEPAVKLAPGRADLFLLLGDAHERNLHLRASIDALREAVRLEPRMSEAWGKLGQNLVNTTQYVEARKPLLQAITHEPTNSYYYWALGDSYLFDTSDPKNEEKAHKLYQQALSLDPKNPKALYSYGMALYRRAGPGDLEKAAGLFQRMLAIKATDMNVQYKLYEIYKALGRPKDSQRHLAAYKDLFGKGQKQTRRLYSEASFLDTAEIHVDLAKAARKKGNLTLALTEYDLALERDPDLAAAKQGRAEVETELAAKGSKP